MKRNNNIDIMKGLAIISVLFAHSNSNSVFFQHIMEVIGIFGVPVFFFLAGFLFENRTLKDILLRKKYIVFKWIISASIIYLYVYLRKSGISIFSYFRFLLGVNSYLYFLSCYFIILVLMCLILKINKNFITRIFFFLSIFFLLKANINFLGSIRPISFFCFFYLGYLFKLKGYFSWIDKNNFKIFVVIFIIVLIVKMNADIKYISYFGMQGAITSILGIILFYNIAYCINKYNTYVKKIMISLGIKSFDIYLWHMLFMGIVNRISIFSSALKPFICIIITYFFVTVFNKISSFGKDKLINEKKYN